MNPFLQFLAAHATTFAASTSLSLIGTAIAREIPEKFPRSIDEWWAWFKNTVQQVLSMKGIPTQPTGSAQQK